MIILSSTLSMAWGYDKFNRTLVFRTDVRGARRLHRVTMWGLTHNVKLSIVIP